MRTVRPVDSIPQEYADAINQAARGLLQPFVNVSGTYSAGAADIVIYVSPSGICTITLPPPSVTKGSIRWVKRANNTTHTVTIQAASGNIDGAASTSLTTAYQSRAFHSDGSNYFLV